MALSARYQARLKKLKPAVKDLELALEEDLSKFSSRQQDLFRNGQVQKFEFSIELLWKTVKAYLFEKKGIDEIAPKSIIKAFYQSENLASNDYEKLLSMIDDRNLLSHVYSEKDFLEIYSHLVDHVKTIRHVVNLIDL